MGFPLLEVETHRL